MGAYRRRAQAILALLRDPERLKRERKEFAARRPAYVGFARGAAPVGLGISSAATFVSQMAREQAANGGHGATAGPKGSRAASPDLRCAVTYQIWFRVGFVAVSCRLCSVLTRILSVFRKICTPYVFPVSQI